MSHASALAIVPANVPEPMNWLHGSMYRFSDRFAVTPHRDPDGVPGEWRGIVEQARTQCPWHYPTAVSDLDVLHDFTTGGLWHQREDGEIERWTTLNPDGHFDEWSVGSAWADGFADADQHPVLLTRMLLDTEVMATMTHGVLTVRGDWRSRGPLGLFGVSEDTTPDEWRATVSDALHDPAADGATVIYLDVHR
ncbi:hypothetical protein NY551_18930 [Curtobacterium flaccumfaciens pv. oortii]|uniref:hypothetical protein n=1 Tax=Curtobacterium flaccumfaciens TaxID=2035 RepID=UPI002657FB76|nr:hypothetical protein [Curtobacterium flaccumfaciens]MCS5524815.1 hypothetical protein [Curtobacterium flaccumfaciens pv. oortii]